MERKKVYLLDAMALIYRAYFALSRAVKITSTGLNTAAILGFANSLLEILKKEQVDFIGVAFDSSRPTVRHEEYEVYKANREKMPEDIRMALPYIKRLLECLNIAIVGKEGYEADDIIGTLAKKAECKGYEVYMVTPDKDYAQLVSEQVYIYKPSKAGNPAEIMGLEEVRAKFGVENPEQVIDLLGMWGDAVDNIPGIPGVGEVTAKKLIAQFGSMEEMFARADEISNEKLREKVRENREQGLLSKKLARIITDVDIDFDEEALSKKGLNVPATRALLEELEMGNLQGRLFKVYQETMPSAPVVKSPAVAVERDLFSVLEDAALGTDSMDSLWQKFQGNHSCVFIEREEDLEAQLIRLSQNTGTIGVYLVQRDADWRKSKIYGLGFCDGQQLYFYKCKDRQGLNPREKEIFSAFFGKENPGMTVIGYHIKRFFHILYNEGIACALNFVDLMLAHYLLESETSHELKYLSRTVGESWISTQADSEGRLDDGADTLLHIFQNLNVLFPLWKVYQTELKNTGVETLFYQVEMPLAKVLVDMEREGVYLDLPHLKAYSLQLNQNLRQIESKIYEYAGETFNIQSPKQLGEILFEKLKIVEKAKKTKKSRQWSTSEDVLQKLADKHPIVGQVLEYRSLSKLKSTYVDALPLLIDSQTGRLHTTYNQSVTATGRLSSQNPNLQNIPIRSEEGKEIRKAFIPLPGDDFVLAADYSQIELRIIAEMSGDEHLLADFENHRDIHAGTAAKIYDVPIEKVDGEMRRKAKTVNFGIIYGISSFGLAERLGIPIYEAADLIEKYYAKYPALKRYMVRTVEEAREKGYVQTLMHRRRYLPDLKSENAMVRAYAERNAVNAPIQGTSADMIKMAMVNIARRLKQQGFQAKMLLQVHDELVFSVKKEEVDALSKMLEEEMKNAMKLKVAVEVGISYAENWLDAH